MYAHVFKTEEVSCPPPCHPKPEYVHLCHLPVSVGSGKTKTVDFVFDLRRWHNPPSSSSTDTVRLTLQSGCSLRSQARVNSESAVRVDVDYVSEIRVSPSDKDAGRRQLGYNVTSVAFNHAFRVTNLGPSPTDGDFSYSVYLPRSALLNVTLLGAGGGGSGGNPSSCRMMYTGRVRADLLPEPRGQLISCSAVESCAVYECGVAAGFARGDSVAVVVRMSFDSRSASDHPEGAKRFTVRSMVRRTESRGVFHKNLCLLWPPQVNCIVATASC